MFISVNAKGVPYIWTGITHFGLLMSIQIKNDSGFYFGY